MQSIYATCSSGGLDTAIATAPVATSRPNWLQISRDIQFRTGRANLRSLMQRHMSCVASRRRRNGGWCLHAAVRSWKRKSPTCLLHVCDKPHRFWRGDSLITRSVSVLQPKLVHPLVCQNTLQYGAEGIAARYMHITSPSLIAWRYHRVFHLRESRRDEERYRKIFDVDVPILRRRLVADM
jgi:hypothetical protein